jgi:hypothetical protein
VLCLPEVIAKGDVDWGVEMSPIPLAPRVPLVPTWAGGPVRLCAGLDM